MAGISINIISGENGFITKSRKIRENIELSSIEGQSKINSLKEEEKYIEDGAIIQNDENAPTINKLEINVLDNSSLKIDVNITETVSGLAKIEYSIDDGETYITPNNNQAKTYTFTDLKLGYEEYKIKVKVTDVNNNSSYTSKTIEKFKIGDYVNYTYDTKSAYVLAAAVSGYSSDQTIAQPSTALKWRILSINDDGTVDLVSETPTDQDVYFKGALGYNNGVYALHDICEKLFSNSSLGITARSINLDDIEAQETEAGTSARTNFAYDSYSYAYGNTVTYSSNKNYPKLYAYQNGSGTESTTVKTNGISESDITATGFEVPTSQTYSTATASEGLTVTCTYYNHSLNSTNYGDAGEVLTASNAYWVASRFTYCGTNAACFGLRYSHGANFTYLSTKTSNHSFYYRLRPIVSLSPNIISVCLGKDSNGAWQISNK